MSAERTKTLWISAAVAAFALVVALAGVFLFAPTRSGAKAPASAGNVAAPKAADPQDYLSAPPPLALSTEPRQGEGDIIVIYGDKPDELPASPAAALGTPAPLAPIDSPVAKPAPAASAAPAAKPATQPAAQPALKPAPSAAAKPSVAKPAKVRVDEYWIQTGSFSRRDLADDQKRELGERGIASLISVKESGETIYYRVRVGPYASKAEAQGWLSKIQTVPGCAESYVSLSPIEVKR